MQGRRRVHTNTYHKWNSEEEHDNTDSELLRSTIYAAWANFAVKRHTMSNDFIDIYLYTRICTHKHTSCGQIYEHTK